MTALAIRVAHQLADGSYDETVVQVPARWVICGHCEGHGKSSSHLGAITSDEWHQDWDEDSRAHYMAGDYDRPCEACDGLGRVLVEDLDAELTAEQRAAIEYRDEEERQAAADRRTAWFESGCPQ